MEEKKYIRYTFILIALTTAVRLYLAYTIGLGVDEAHYVQYALHPALSYYDHPPLVGYLIRLFLITLGKSLITVRMPAIIASVGVALLLFITGKKLYGVQAGFWSVVIFNSIPLFSAIGGITIVPDTVLCFFWLVIIITVWQIYKTGKGYLWYSAGLITGLALLTKYTAFLIYPSILLFIILVPSMRKYLKGKELYTGFLISLIMFLPVFIWNYENHWASFLFQFSHGMGEKTFFDLETFLKNIGAQAGVFSPFIFFFLIYTLIITFKQALTGEVKAILLISFSLPVLLLFAYSGMSNQVLPHWPATGYLSLIPALGSITCGFLSSPVRKKIKNFFIISLFTGVLLTLFIPVQIIFRPLNLSPEIDISQDITGWEEIAKRIKEIKIKEKESDFFVFTHKFYIAGQLAYYLEPEVGVYCLSKRMDQYDFWQYNEDLKISLKGKNGLFFCDDRFKTEVEKVYKFRKIEGPEILPVYQRGSYVKNFYIYRCYGFDTEGTNPLVLQSLNFTPGNFKEDIIRWNERTFFFINSFACKNKVLDIIFVFLSSLGSSFILVPLVLLLVFLKKKKLSGNYIAVFLISLIIGGIIVHILKDTLDIPRPLSHFGRDNVNILGPQLKKGSFPSGHSQTVFTGVLFLSWIIPEWTVFFWTIGILSGISRCYMGAHFPLDIAGGFLISVISFLAVKTLFENKKSIREFYIKHRKAIKRTFYLAIFLILLFFLIPYNKNPIYVDTGDVVKNIRIIKPLAVKLFTPFTDFPLYFINTPSPLGTLLSWFILLSVIWAIWTLYHRKAILKIIRGIYIILLSLCLLVIYGIFLPVQRYKFVPENANEILIDLHSHTIYSYDGIVTAAYNLQWHSNYGFKCWAITEHKNSGIAAILQEEIIRRKNIPLSCIPAQEIKFKGVYLNLMGIEKDINKKEFDNLKELIDAVHRNGGAVIVPHIWAAAKSKISLKEIVEAGVDGFEIVGISSVPLTPEKQREIIQLCKENKLVMVSGTNWHGWNNLCNMWTSFKVENWEKLNEKERRKVALDALRARETERFKVITFYYPYPSKNIILAPFTQIYSYISSLDKIQRFFWIFWAVSIFFLLNLIKNRRLMVITLWFFISTLLLLKALYFLELWSTVKDINSILPDVSIGLFIFSIITFFTGFSHLKHR